MNTHSLLQSLTNAWGALPGYAQSALWSTLWVLVVTIVVILHVAYLTLWERKVIGWMQLRRGPNRVTLFGLPFTQGFGQPFADVVKLLLKEIVIPVRANRFLFRLAPMIALIPAFAAWAVVPLHPGFAISNANAGLLYLLSLSSMGVYGIILAGWASNSKYAFLGAMRSAAQMVAYEIAMGFALVGVLMASRSMNLSDIVAGQSGGVLSWWFIPLFPLLIVYFISGVAETNRAPFDVAEGESEIVAGFHVEYSGMAFALFFLAEYANMILIATLTAVFFFGGWQAPLQGWAWLQSYPVLNFLFGTGSVIWLWIKMFVLVFFFLWFRATFPRYRYDQIMRLGWKALIPVTLVWIAVEMVMAHYQFGPWSRTLLQ